MPLTESEILQRGRDAQALLDDERVMDGLHRLSERITADWRATSRALPIVRDELHAQVAAIDALVSLWGKDVDEAKFLTARIEKRSRSKS